VLAGLIPPRMLPLLASNEPLPSRRAPAYRR